MNDTDYSFTISNLNLAIGLHLLVFLVTVKDYSSLSATAKDSAYVTIKEVKNVSSGTSNFNLGGVTLTSISVDLKSGVNIIIDPSSSPPSGTSSAFQNLQSNGVVGTNYFIEFTLSNEAAVNTVWINISYANWDLQALGISNEKTLAIYYYNATLGKWVPAGNTGVDTTNKMIYAYVNHLSAFSAVSAPIPVNSTTSIVKTTTNSNGQTNTTTSLVKSSSQNSITKGLPGLESPFVILFFVITGVLTLQRRYIFRKNNR